MTTKSTSHSSPGVDGDEAAAGIVLFRLDGDGKRRFLVLRHGRGGHWGFPKGRIEPGEGEQATALREVLEETGIGDVEPIPAFRSISRYRFSRRGRSIDKTVAYFLGRTRSSTIRLSPEHTEGRWLAFLDSRRILTHEESRRVLDEAGRFLARC